MINSGSAVSSSASTAIVAIHLGLVSAYIAINDLVTKTIDKSEARGSTIAEGREVYICLGAKSLEHYTQLGQNPWLYRSASEIQPVPYAIRNDPRR